MAGTSTSLQHQSRYGKDQHGPLDRWRPCTREWHHTAPKSRCGQIRDLLFATKMQDYDRRFQKLEDASTSASRKSETDTARNLSAFESMPRNRLTPIEPAARRERRALGRRQGDRTDVARTKPNPGRSVCVPCPTVEPAGTRYGRPSDPGSPGAAREIKRRNEDTQHTLEKMFADWPTSRRPQTCRRAGSSRSPNV